MFLNVILQRLKILSCTVHNIIARFSESGETGATGQGHESVLACDS